MGPAGAEERGEPFAVSGFWRTTRYACCIGVVVRADVTDLAGGLCCCCWKLPAAPDTAQRLLLQGVMLHLMQLLVVPGAVAHLVTLLLPGSNACRMAAAAAGGAHAAV